LKARKATPLARIQLLILDVDHFFSFLAVTMLIAQHDSYPLNRNNYRIYHDPVSDRFVMIPHGIDGTFTENNLWSGVGTTPCNGHSQGDPVAIYDWLADRFVITWFAFVSSGGPFYHCIAASKTGDPVSIPAKRVPYFKPGKELKELINEHTAPSLSAADGSLSSNDDRPPMF